MINEEIIERGSLCHALIYSPSNTDIIIPIKGVVMKIDFDINFPIYAIKVIKFYDHIDFLKQHINEKTFHFGAKNGASKVKFPNDIKTAESLVNWFETHPQFYFHAESIFVFKTKDEMMQMYNKIQEFIIFRNIRSIQNSVSRSCYNGDLKMTKTEFRILLEKTFSSKFATVEKFQQFLDFIGGIGNFR